ncbi:hypothetical protein, partial [Helicobacter sp. UBA3407]|uniref:hypothetical protein n=1 Tax=Helicobacter sp. UBA3407 TaxID=1946588 RepID=UPI002637ECBF
FSLIIFLIFFARALPEIICNLNLAFYFLFYSFYDFIILFFKVQHYRLPRKFYKFSRNDAVESLLIEWK